MNSHSRWGDRALLLAVMAVGLLPFLGWAFGHPAKNWELGVGVLAVLGAGASFVLDLFPPRRER